ncbi:MAG TPA: thioredoxin family protein [Fimbriimonadaceae bacterium]|nr:thioredoxin family protein [Fimbriimonadaceae bacterium]
MNRVWKLALAGMLAALAASSMAGGIKWSANLAAALKLAKKSHKPVMVDFYGDSCGSCRMLDDRTYPDKSVVQFARGVVPVKIEYTRQPRLIEKYGIQETPTIMFLDQNGKMIGYFTGFHPPAEFLAESAKILKKQKSK